MRVPPAHGTRGSARPIGFGAAPVRQGNDRTRPHAPARRAGRPICAVAIAAALSCLAAGADAAAFSLDARRSGEAIELAATADLRAEPGHAWAVLTAYERYAEFIPDISESRVVRRHGDSLVIELAGAVRLLWWRVPLTVRLAVEESPPHRVHARLIEGSVEALRGRYELEPIDGGVRLVYTGAIVPDRRHRSLFDQFVIRINVARQFRALIGEIERSSAVAARARAMGQ